MFFDQKSLSFYDYKLSDSCIEVSDEDYKQLLMGQGEGKIIGKNSEGYPILLNVEPTNQELCKQYEVAIQSYMDTKANLAGYDDIKTAVTYADEPIVAKFQADGKAFRKWRSLVWDYTYQQLDMVMSNQRVIPTIQELLLELPEMEDVV